MSPKVFLAIASSFVVVFSAAAQTTSTIGTSPRPGKVLREAVQQKIQTLRQETQQDIEKAREDFRQKIVSMRSNLTNAIQVNREELKTKLQNIKDETKKNAVERIDRSMTDLNNLMTTHYANVLDNLSDILKRIVSRTDKAQANGKDVSSVRTAIAKAQTAIDAARAAVAAQVGKVYSLNITTDSKLKGVVGDARKALRDDLKKAADSVKAAREAVRSAATELAKIPGIGELKNSTSNATSANVGNATSQ